MKYLPGKKAAALLGIHQNTLRKYADRGIIPSFKTASGQRRYDVDAFLNQPAEIETVCLVKGGDKVYHCGVDVQRKGPTGIMRRQMRNRAGIHQEQLSAVPE